MAKRADKDAVARPAAPLSDALTLLPGVTLSVDAAPALAATPVVPAPMMPPPAAPLPPPTAVMPPPAAPLPPSTAVMPPPAAPLPPPAAAPVRVATAAAPVRVATAAPVLPPPAAAPALPPPSAPAPVLPAPTAPADLPLLPPPTARPVPVPAVATAATGVAVATATSHPGDYVPTHRAPTRREARRARRAGTDEGGIFDSPTPAPPTSDRRVEDLALDAKPARTGSSGRLIALIAAAVLIAAAGALYVLVLMPSM